MRNKLSIIDAELEKNRSNDVEMRKLNDRETLTYRPTMWKWES